MEAVPNLHNFMSGLPEAAVYDIRACFRPRRCADREVIFHGGDQPDYIFQIASGTVALCNYAVDGQEIILAKFQAGRLGRRYRHHGRKTADQYSHCHREAEILSLEQRRF